MADIDFNGNLYKTPSDEILRQRKAFYGLFGRPDDHARRWLNRIQCQFNRCDFPPMISREYLLIDKFVCGLNSVETELMRNISTWTLLELTEYFKNANTNIESPSSLATVKYEFVSTNLIKHIDL